MKNTLDERYITQAKIYIANNFLDEFGKKEGDIVEWSFMNFTGNSQKCYQGLKKCRAEIKRREDGTVYIKSIDPCKDAFEEWNGLFGRRRGTYWKFEEVYPEIDLVKINCLSLDFERDNHAKEL